MSTKRIIPVIVIILLTSLIALAACQANKAEEAVEAPSTKDVAEVAKRVEAEQSAPAQADEVIAQVEDAPVPAPEAEVLPLKGDVPEFVPPKPVTLDMQADGLAFAMGDPEAAVQIVEFADYQCPFCARHALQTMPEIVEKLVESERVFYAIKDMPLDTIHPEARSASVAARCAGEQDAYLPMHDAIYEVQAEWSGAGSETTAVFADLASDLELDVDAFSACMVDGRQAENVQANFEEAMSFGVNSTPFFFINGYAVSGAQPYGLFEMAVELAESGQLADTVEAQARQAYESMLAQQEAPAEPAAAEQAAPQPTELISVALDNAYAIGDPDAPVTIVEYTDYQCPFCARHSLQTFGQIAEEMVETGQVRYVFKDLPLTALHPQATLAAEAARCAGAQEEEAFVVMHDALFENQKAWSGNAKAGELFAEYAAEMGLDHDSFSTCLEEHTFEAAVQADMKEATELGISGTPAFVINGQPVFGALPFEAFERVVEHLMAEMPVQAASS